MLANPLYSAQDLQVKQLNTAYCQVSWYAASQHCESEGEAVLILEKLFKQ